MYNPIYKNVSLSLSSSIKHKNRGSTYFFFKMELYLCPANQINLQLMKIKTFMLLLMLSAGACTVPTFFRQSGHTAMAADYPTAEHITEREKASGSH